MNTIFLGRTSQSCRFSLRATFVAQLRMCAFIVLLLSAVFSSPIHAQAETTAVQSEGSKVPEELKGIGVTEHLGDQVALHDLAFQDETGKSVKLEQYFTGQRPVLLTLVYYECPSLCNILLNSLVDTMKGMPFTPGKEFEIVTVSINPREKSDLAKLKKEKYLENYGRPEAASGWHFLTGQEPQIQALAKQVGFGYRWDPTEKQYAHSAVLFLLSPEGKITRYLYGIGWQPRDLKFALIEASQGRVGSVIDRVLLFCYQYNPTTRKYSLYLTKVMQAGSAITVLFFAGYMAFFWRRQRRRNSNETTLGS